MNDIKYRRILLKLSGEAFAGDLHSGIDLRVVERYASEIKDLRELGVQIGVVIGGGNIWRGRVDPSMQRTTADSMGMLATVINALALEDRLENIGVPARVQTAIAMRQVAEPVLQRRAVRHLEKGRVVIFAAGTGNPYFTTDTTAALRALEIGAEVVCKATLVDGVYDMDPRVNPGAVKFKEISYVDVIRRELKVMDSTAISLCWDNKLPILVFDGGTHGNIRRIVLGEEIGTLVKEGN